MKKITIIYIIFVIILFAGCYKVDNDSSSLRENNDKDNTINKNDKNSEIKQDNLEIKRKGLSESLDADKLIERFIYAINNEDTDTLMTCVDSYDKRKEGIKKAINFYKIYFDNKPIEEYEYLQKDNENSTITYIYSISSKDGKKKLINIRKDDDEYLIGFDNFIRYSEYADRKANSFVESIKLEDVKSLAFDIWNSIEPINDEGCLEIYPIEDAKKVLNKYQQYFDLNTISIKFTGNTTLKNGDGFFTFLIEGKSNSLQKEHKINIIYGDGQVGIEDEWIPEIHGYDILCPKSDEN